MTSPLIARRISSARSRVTPLYARREHDEFFAAVASDQIRAACKTPLHRVGHGADADPCPKLSLKRLKWSMSIMNKDRKLLAPRDSSRSTCSLK